MKLRVGVAPDSWGVWFPEDPLQTPWQRYLDEVVEAGFDFVELGPYGYLPTDPPTLRAELEARGLSLMAANLIGQIHDPAALPALREQWLRATDLIAQFDGRFMVLLPDGYRDANGAFDRSEATEDEWRQMVETSNDLGRLLQERYPSIQLTFHSHVDSYIETPEQLERLVAETDPNLVKICLDLGHYAYHGGDSTDFMRRHHQRIPYLHLKSVDGALRERVHREKLSMPEAVRLGTFCEPQDGAIDFPAFVALLREIDYDGWSVVEQDMYPCDFDRPLPIARRTRAYFNSLGLG